MKTPMKTVTHFLTIDENCVDQRIDNFLFTYLKKVPKSHIYRVIRKGEVRVNKKRIKPDYRLALLDMVRIPPYWEAPTQLKIPPRQEAILNFEKYILFEDKKLLIINKPAGMPVHGGTNVSFGVIDLARLARPQEKYLELAHRLDRDTSGCLLLAKKPSVLKEIHSLLREGHVLKQYWALVKGHWPSKQTRIDVPLLKNQLKSGERIVTVDSAGKEALTTFKVLKYLKDCTLLEITLHTGRTHQIRVHTAYAKCPIVGDEKYGDKAFNQKMRAEGHSRMFLHAKHLLLELPLSNQVINITAELDSHFESCLSCSA
jgi:23S rRNA pseudouridine955/2504/2580 synthase